MSIITHVDYNSSSDSIAYSDNMSISSSSPLVTYQGQCTPTSDLEYAPKEPSPIQFGNVKPVKPIILQPLKLEDEHSDEDESHPFSPDSPFNKVYPAQVRIKIEEFEENHNAREVKAKKINRLLISTVEATASFANLVNNSLKSLAQLLKRHLKM